MAFSGRGCSGLSGKWQALSALSTAALIFTPTSIFASPAEDFCKAMQDQFVVCQEESAKGNNCYNAMIVVFNASEEARKSASSAQSTEIDRAMNLWADMVNPDNKSTESAKIREIAALCNRIRQAK